MIGKQFIPLVKQLRSTEEPVWWRGLRFEADLDDCPECALMLFRNNRGYWLCVVVEDTRHLRVYDKYLNFEAHVGYRFQWTDYIAHVTNVDYRHLTPTFPIPKLVREAKVS